MSADESTLPERAASCYSQLSAAAQDLNRISDELGKPISEIDLALKKLNLGVAVWIPIRQNDGRPQMTWFWSEEIGYAKVGANWGICLRKVAGDDRDPDGDDVEFWLFNDAPRTLRISAIGKIPDLLEMLSKEAVKTTEDIRAGLSDVQAVANAVKGVASRARLPLHIPPSPSTKPETASTPSPRATTVESVRSAVVSALKSTGQHSAAQVLSGGDWTMNGGTIHIVAQTVGKKMLALTVNATAEKIIREELERLGIPARFTVTPAASSAAMEVEK